MMWLREHGAIGCYDDYVGLPLRVLQDARLCMEAEAAVAKRNRAKAAMSQQQGARRGFRR